MEAILPFLPELDPIGGKADGAPFVRAGHRTGPQLDFHLFEPHPQLVQSADLFPLPGNMRLQLMAARTLSEKLLGQLARGDLGPALDPNLPSQRRSVPRRRM